MKVEIITNSLGHADICFEGKLCSEYFSFDKKASLLERALVKLDGDIDYVASTAKTDYLGVYLWCITYDIHRSDGLQDAAEHYYILEQIIELSQTHQINNVVVKYPFPVAAIELFKNNLDFNVIYSANFLFRVKIWFRYKFGPLKDLLNTVLFSLSYSHKSVQKLKDCINGQIVLARVNHRNERIKGYPQGLLKNGDVFILDITLLKIENIHTNRIYRIKVISLRIILNSIIKLIRFNAYKKSYIKRKEVYNKNFVAYIKGQSLFQTFYIFILEELYRKIFISLKPISVTVSSTFGDPRKRLPLYVSKSLNIKSILFSCRPYLSKLRSEDRLINADLEEYHHACIGDEIIMLDEFSKKYAESFNINKPVFIFETKESNSINVRRINNSIILLLTDIETNNHLLFDLKKYTKSFGLFSKLYYKEHPNDRLTLPQKEIVRTISDDNESISGLSWSEIVINNSVAIVSNSTAGIEASYSGAKIFWTPYMSKGGLFLYPLMKSVGKICLNEHDLFNELSLFSIETPKE